MKNITVKSDVSIRHAMKKLSNTGEKCLVIIDENNKLLGTLSDGDLRKAILKGAKVNDLIKKIYNSNPTVLIKNKYNNREVKKLFTQFKFDLIPIIDNKGNLDDILVWENIFKNDKNNRKNTMDVPVVIMAGGKGTRLEPFTNILPKPLIPINEKPVIEHIIDSFTKVGIKNFILTLNYKARIMKAFFEELNADYKVNFIQEDKPLGTAGSLKLLKNKMDKPFMVTNCDIIIKADYPDLFSFHLNNNYDITLVASMKNYVIPYGTCKLSADGTLGNIDEKPEYNLLVNTGLYVLNPDVLDFIPSNKHFHITDLIARAKKKGKKIGVYPVDDDAWIDIGQWNEYQKAVDKF